MLGERSEVAQLPQQRVRSNLSVTCILSCAHCPPTHAGVEELRMEFTAGVYGGGAWRAALLIITQW